MHTLLQSHMAHALADTFERTTRAAGGRIAAESRPVVIRRAADTDLPALETLAELDGRSRSARRRLQGALDDGGVLLAEVDGSLRAALPVRGGGVVADPFVSSAGLAELLALRAGQLRHAA